ncbi:hypothetical protein [Caballeronia arvi]|uniref:hypothetical protein n=1 Tax=Caballeronia arvi TaxID=1777135 RepID=UPI000772B9A8|nr:hypothetical protein [Caballeronia arvi]
MGLDRARPLKRFAMLEADATRADMAGDPGEALTAQGLAYVEFARAHPADGQDYACRTPSVRALLR